MSRNEPELSVIIPVYNEEEVLRDTLDRLQNNLVSLSYSHEVLLVDDGSSDQSWNLIEEAVSTDEWNLNIRGIRLSRNFGHQSAVTAGLENAQGDATVVMDADLQDPPNVIPEFLEKWEQGYDVVYGIRTGRKEGFLKQFAYRFFYRILAWASPVQMPLDAGDFSLMDRRVVDEINSIPERNRFVRGLRAWVGFSQTGVKYERGARKGGETKYTFRRLMKLALDGILSFSVVPLRIAIFIGLLTSAGGFGFLTYVLVLKFLGTIETAGWASTMSVILFLGGMQLIVLGIVGEYIGRIYDEVKERPVYIISDRYEGKEELS